MPSFKDNIMSFSFNNDSYLTGLIYRYTCKLNGKSYIGKSMTYRFEYRQFCHWHYKDTKTKFGRAKLKYGKENFVLDILEKDIPKNLLSEREKFWIKKHNTLIAGYNSTAGGEGGNTYAGKSKRELDLIKKKIFIANSGNNNGNKGQYVGPKNPMYGKRAPNAVRLLVMNIFTGESYTFESYTKFSEFLGYVNANPVMAMKKNHKVKRGFVILKEGVETTESIKHIGVSVSQCWRSK